MTRVSILPHRWVVDGVRPGPWSAFVRGEELDTTSPISGWDRVTPIEVRCEVRIDVGRVRAGCGLPDDDPVLLVATWHATGTNARRTAARLAVAESATYPVSFAIDPAVAAGRVHLARTLVLAAAGTSDDPLTAHAPGAVLWREGRSEGTTLVLESAGARFTTEAVDFANVPAADAAAAWLMTIDLDDLHAAPSRGLQLFVNTAHPAIDHLLAGADDEQGRMAASVLRWEVARRLVDRGLDDPRFEAGFGGFVPDTIGGVIQQLLERWLPGRLPGELRAMRTQDLARFDALLQARFQLLRWS
jgi:hypothetical protein